MNDERLYPIGRTTDLTGYRFYRLIVLGPQEHPSRGRYWLCRCDCGELTTASTDNLNRGNVRSGGCFKEEQHETHGMAGTPEHYTWANMIQRCTNPNTPMFKYYGGRGITVTSPWLNSFEAFYADMGPRPSDQHSIERREVNGNYEPGNCYWATPDVQANNKTNNIKHLHNGEELTSPQLSRRYGADEPTVRQRIKRGLSVDEALNPQRTNGREFLHLGRMLSLDDLVEISGHPYATLYYRLVTSKWTVERALTTPSRKSK